ncbi:MAG: aminotransferase class I/II-fold pyridoxal phosphate-dependent enzyme, partial [Rhodanobacteraceae bacterium]
MRPNLLRSLATRVAEREYAGLLRRARALDSTSGTRVAINGHELLNFCSNDYLGLAQDPRIVKVLQDAANDYGIGGTASHLVCGHHREHEQLEQALCEWTGRDAALLFSSGWLANLGAMQALLNRDSVCVQDKLNHASLLDAAQLSGATLKRYPHVDHDGAARQLASISDKPALLATDGVFSMDGDVAPLAEIVELARKYRAAVTIDEAHAVGVVGPNGAGLVAKLGLEREVDIHVGTLSKALGAYG